MACPGDCYACAGMAAYFPETDLAHRLTQPDGRALSINTEGSRRHHRYIPSSPAPRPTPFPPTRHGGPSLAQEIPRGLARRDFRPHQQIQVRTCSPSQKQAQVDTVIARYPQTPLDASTRPASCTHCSSPESRTTVRARHSSTSASTPVERSSSRTGSRCVILSLREWTGD